MTPSEKEKIIKEGFDAIGKVYNLRGDLLEDAGKLEAAKESNRKLSDRVANLEVTIRTLNSAIDKKDVEIRALKAANEALERKRDSIYDIYLKRCHECDANENIMRRMIADSRKKKDEIKSLRENNAKLEDNFHELRHKFSDIYLRYVHDILQIGDLIAFTDWFKDTFGDFGVYDEEE